MWVGIRVVDWYTNYDYLYIMCWYTCVIIYASCVDIRVVDWTKGGRIYISCVWIIVVCWNTNCWYFGILC